MRVVEGIKPLLLLLFGGEKLFNWFKWRKHKVVPVHAGNDLFLGEKLVKPRKVTPVVWKQLFEKIEDLPAWIIQTMLIHNREDFPAYLAHLIRESTDEIVKLTSILSGIDEKYIEENASIPEITEYITKTAELNDFSGALKNLKSLLPANLLGMFTEAEAE